jgi:hypothetical protein
VIRITVGPLAFRARFEDENAPRTVAAFRRLLPYRESLIHARWSGEAGWVPLGDFRLDVPAENATERPAPGQILFYPGGISETEILVPYGVSRFACKDGPLAGNHFLTVVDGPLSELGTLLLRKGAQPISFEAPS